MKIANVQFCTKVSFSIRNHILVDQPRFLGYGTRLWEHSILDAHWLKVCFFMKKNHFFTDLSRGLTDPFLLVRDPILTKSSKFSLFPRIFRIHQGSLPDVFWSLPGPSRPLGSGVLIKKNKFLHFRVFRCPLIEYARSNRSESGFPSFMSCLTQLNAKLKNNEFFKFLPNPSRDPFQTPSAWSETPFGPYLTMTTKNHKKCVFQNMIIFVTNHENIVAHHQKQR